MAFFAKHGRVNVFPIIDAGEFGTLDEKNGFDGVDDILTEGDSATERTNVFVGNVLSASRLRMGKIVTVVLFGFLLVRVGYWSIVKTSYFSALADQNRSRTIVTPAHRGVLLDRNGVLLAWNEPDFRLLVSRKDLPKNPNEQAKAFTEVAALVNVDTAIFIDTLTHAGANDNTLLLVDDIPYDVAMTFNAKASRYPGFSIELASRRAYVTNTIPSLSHVLGYTASISSAEYAAHDGEGYRAFDDIGKEGIEAVHEAELRGTNGIVKNEVTSTGGVLRVLASEESVAGKDLTLTVDAGLTSAIERILAARLLGTGLSRAAVVAMNPQNGEVFALVSLPTFDANAFTEGIGADAYAQLTNDPNKPLFQRAVSGEYPSGSVIKPVYASAALNEKIITPTTTFLSTGGLRLGDRFFPDWRPGGHGVTNVYHAIADSVNTFFYIIGGGTASFEGLGLEKLMDYASRFGYGAKTGIDLTNEASGFLPTKAWKEESIGEPWYIGDTYNTAIGQGYFLVTPLQVARAVSAVANGGVLVTPHLVVDEDAPTERIMDADVENVVRDAMRQTVTQGTARSLNDLPVPVAGKTGTAQWSNTYAPHSWFTGFAPFDNPTFAVTVLIEQGGNLNIATPVAKDIFAWWFANR